MALPKQAPKREGLHNKAGQKNQGYNPIKGLSAAADTGRMVSDKPAKAYKNRGEKKTVPCIAAYPKKKIIDRFEGRDILNTAIIAVSQKSWNI